MKKYYSRPPTQPDLLAPLRKEVKEANFGEWAYIPKDTDTLRLCKFEERDMPVVTLCFEVSPNLEWCTMFRGREMEIPEKENLPERIDSLEDIRAILRTVDHCHVCTGVTNPKYKPIVDSHENVFRNVSGTLCMHEIRVSLAIKKIQQ